MAVQLIVENRLEMGALKRQSSATVVKIRSSMRAKHAKEWPKSIKKTGSSRKVARRIPAGLTKQACRIFGRSVWRR